MGPRRRQRTCGAGAHWVLTEGRDSGTVGLFTTQGDVRRTVVDAVVASVGLDVVLFEAPQRAQQAWLIRHFGQNVNLGNISVGDALSVETLRLGLRSDTMDAPLRYRVPGTTVAAPGCSLVIPRQYRTVAFTDVEIDLDEQSLREFFLSRQVYRRTRFVVARRGAEIAVVELVKTAEEDLFVDVAQVRMLARPEETILVVRPDIDTAVPSLLARVAADAPDGIRCVVVRGRYEHINFILDGAPRRIHVLDVAPPWPAKLVDQVQRVVDTAEDLPATECVPQVVDLEDLAAAAPARHYLLPCRGGGMSVPGAMISYLDEVPPRGGLDSARLRPFQGHPRPLLSGPGRHPAPGRYLSDPPGDDAAAAARRGAPDQMLPARGAHRDPRRHGRRPVGLLVHPCRAGSLARVRPRRSTQRGVARPDRRKGPRVSARITDSLSYAHLWGTPELRSVFEETERLQGWLDVLAALARAQAAEGQIPAEAAEVITREARVERLDLARVAEGTRETGHSTLGLIHELRRVLPESARAHIYVGATVQDVTDTWTALAMRTVGGIAWRDLRAIEATLIDLATRYRDSLIAGRTHGQPGAPATFGWKVASWADETRRHLDRLREGSRRWLVARAWRRSRHPRRLRRAEARRPGPLRSGPRARRPGHLLAQLARPYRRVRQCPHDGHRHSRPDRRRGL